MIKNAKIFWPTLGEILKVLRPSFLGNTLPKDDLLGHERGVVEDRIKVWSMGESWGRKIKAIVDGSEQGNMKNKSY